LVRRIGTSTLIRAATILTGLHRSLLPLRDCISKKTMSHATAVLLVTTSAMLLKCKFVLSVLLNKILLQFFLWNLLFRNISDLITLFCLFFKFTFFMVKCTSRILKGQNLPGTLPPELTRLPYLQVMYVIPKLSLASKLKILLKLFFNLQVMY